MDERARVNALFDIACRALLFSVLLLTPVSGVRAMPDGATVTFETSAPADDTVFLDRVTAMRRHVDDPEARFSVSEAVRALRTLRDHAAGREDLLPQRREILSMIGGLALKSPTMEFEEGLEPLAELMKIGIGEDRPPERRMWDHFAYAELSAGHATLPGNSASHSLAADQYGAAAAIADTLKAYAGNRSAGIRQEQAYELHEAGRYEEALAMNRQVLAFGEELYGPETPLLASVLTNLAQNLHALGRREEIEPYLLRVQAIGEAEGDLARVEDMLFQRGVLAYEMGRTDEARTLMLERIERLEEAGDETRTAAAREDHAELERRLLVGE